MAWLHRALKKRFPSKGASMVVDPEKDRMMRAKMRTFREFIEENFLIENTYDSDREYTSIVSSKKRRNSPNSEMARHEIHYSRKKGDPKEYGDFPKEVTDHMEKIGHRHYVGNPMNFLRGDAHDERRYKHTVAANKHIDDHNSEVSKSMSKIKFKPYSGKD
jgi:hypothetical protein